jgi:hypothetical protein
MAASGCLPQDRFPPRPTTGGALLRSLGTNSFSNGNRTGPRPSTPWRPSNPRSIWARRIFGPILRSLRRRERWGDSTFRGLDGGTLVSATATSGSLQAALLRTIPLGAPAELGLGFQKLGQPPLDLTGGPIAFTLGEKTNASGWSVRAMDPGGVNAVNPGRYELTFFSTAPSPAARYTNDKPEWRDGNLSPLMVAPRLDDRRGSRIGPLR